MKSQTQKLARGIRTNITKRGPRVVFQDQNHVICSAKVDSTVGQHVIEEDMGSVVGIYDEHCTTSMIREDIEEVI